MVSEQRPYVCGCMCACALGVQWPVVGPRLRPPRSKKRPSYRYHYTSHHMYSSSHTHRTDPCLLLCWYSVCQPVDASGDVWLAWAKQEQAAQAAVSTTHTS
jgi:hypothetical protein